MTDEPQDDEEAEVPAPVRWLTKREYYLLPAAAGFGFIAGLWFGLWSVPDAALSVPMETELGQKSPAFMPVPTWLPVGTVGLLVVFLWIGWQARDAGVEYVGEDDE